jgi:DNA repair protein RadC
MLKILDPVEIQRGFYIFVTVIGKAPIKNVTIKDWAYDDRPREKLLLKGHSALSDAELIAILVSSGSKEESAVDVSKKILALTQNNLNDLAKLSINDLKKIKGIGPAKAIAITAALELGRRRKQEDAKEQLKIRTSKDAYRFFEPLLGDLRHEEFWVLLLNSGNRIVGNKRVSEGGLSGTVADVKIIFKHAVEHLATSVVLCHNHPSGNLKPSLADILLTRKLKEAGKLLEVSVVDHIVIGDGGYFSFADGGVL